MGPGLSTPEGHRRRFPATTTTQKGSYRANAAAAKYSELVCYGPQRTHSYLYGGICGSIQTIAAAEMTVGVWDGCGSSWPPEGDHPYGQSNVHRPTQESLASFYGE